MVVHAHNSSTLQVETERLEVQGYTHTHTLQNKFETILGYLKMSWRKKKGYPTSRLPLVMNHKAGIPVLIKR